MTPPTAASSPRDAASRTADADTRPTTPAKPSFTRGIFLGELREDLVFPFPTLSSAESESLHMAIDAFRDFAAASIDSHKHDHDARFDPKVLEGMHALGLMGVNIPEEYGGFGASSKVANRIFGEIGATDPALAVYFGAHQSIGCKGIILFGNEAQKRKYLPRCASGETIAAFCLTEPGSGSDAQAMRTEAVPSEDGSHYVLNGTKIWISNAGYAGLFTVFAKVPTVVDGVRKLRVTAFIVDAHAEGVRLGKLEDKMGIKASDTRTVFFENVRVPVEDRLGEVGQGFKIALEVLNSGRLGLAAGSARGVRAIMRGAIAHAKQREQFGRPIGTFEMIQKKFAVAAAECYAIDSAVMLTAGLVDRGDVDYSLETAACKVFGSELAYRTANEAMQIAGGIGYSKEYPYEQAVRDSRINLIFEGTNEVLRALVALTGLQQPGERLAALGKALEAPIRSLGAIGSFLSGQARKTLAKPAFTKVHPALAAEAAQVSELVHDLAVGVDRVLTKHGKKIIERQFLQERLADAAIDIYLATAVLSRTTWELERVRGDEGQLRAELDCARLFLDIAYRRARRNIRALRGGQDGRMKALAERALETLEVAPEAPTER
ncbi:MAG TPA: acyl-CoA dehydrogenase family protein [Gemmatimonadaceae bacterium]|nr:acyl-CoA dehydrogenase family protein [Gemmatimonadaceae bacterium]